MRLAAARCLYLFWGILIAGCAAVDPRVEQEHPAQDSLAQISGRYINTPSYYSQEHGLVGTTDLGEMLCGVNLGSDGRSTAGREKVEFIALNFTQEHGLQVSLERADQPVATCALAPGAALTVEAGAIVLKDGGCGIGLQTGCARHDIALFVNDSGDLVVTSSGGGLGFATLLPVAQYAKLMSIFPRVQ